MFNWLSYNGQLHPKDAAIITASDRGFLLGHGCFTTLKIKNSIPLYYDAHYERLKKTADFLGLDAIDKEALLDEIILLVTKNNEHDKDACMRISFTATADMRGLAPSEIYQCNRLLQLFPAQPAKPTKLVTLPKQQESEFVQHKLLNYVPNILAKQHAIRDGFDDALFVNKEGAITEATTANVFFIKDNVVYTPSKAQGIFTGIMRGAVIKALTRHHIEVVEKAFSKEAIQSADTIFLTNSLHAAIPVVKIDEKAMPFDANHTIIQFLKESRLD